jgi:hypothetical protein
VKRLPADVLLDRKVEAMIAGGYPLPSWGWPTPATYNGATGAERIYVWQKNNLAWRLGWLPRKQTCSVCEARPAEQQHGELYFRPFAIMPVCRSCHARIHRRFGIPDRWQAFTADLTPDNWARLLLTEQIERLDAIRIAAEPDWLAALNAFREARQAEQ